MQASAGTAGPAADKEDVKAVLSPLTLSPRYGIASIVECYSRTQCSSTAAILELFIMLLVTLLKVGKLYVSVTH